MAPHFKNPITSEKLIQIIDLIETPDVKGNFKKSVIFVIFLVFLKKGLCFLARGPKKGLKLAKRILRLTLFEPTLSKRKSISAKH